MKRNVTFALLAIFGIGVLTFSSCEPAIELTEFDNPYDHSGEDGILYDVAGVAGERGGTGDGENAKLAFFYWPMDITLDPEGRLLVVDFNNHCVRRIEANGTINRIIGSGFLGDNPTGTALNVNLNHPSEITIGPNGNFWLSAWHNWKVKFINKSTGDVTSPIGTSIGFGGDGGTADTCKTNLPSSTVFDAQGNVYLCDQGNQRIRKVDAVTNIITTLAGSTSGYMDGIGTAAQFALPTGSNAGPGGKMALTNDGNYLVVADTENNRVRKVSIASGEVTTIAGTGTVGYTGDGGSALSATLYWPTDIAIGPDDAIYVADAKNNVVRKIDSSGNISTVAGTGVAGFSANGTKATEAMLYQPSGIMVTADNILYIADTYNQQVKKVKNP